METPAAPDTAPIRVQLVDDHRLVRKGIRTLLGRYPDLLVVGEADSGPEALALIPEVLPHVVLMDISMPEGGGLAAAEALHRQYPNVRVLFLSMHIEPEYVIKAVKSGAAGYLPKTVEGDELVDAIRRVATGQTYFSAEVSAAVLSSYAPQHRQAAALGGVAATDDDGDTLLTPREKEVLRLIADGLSTKEIADKLSISFRTVETHRVNIGRKLRTANTAEMVKLAILYKLIEY